MRARVVGVVVAGVLGLGPAGCGPGVDCTAAGCASSVRFSSAVGGDAERVRACLDDVCVEADADGMAEVDGEPWISVNQGGDVFLVLPDGDWSGERTAVLLVRDGLGQVVERREQLLELERSQPNGPDCEPTCWNGTVAG